MDLKGQITFASEIWEFRTFLLERQLSLLLVDHEM